MLEINNLTVSFPVSHDHDHEHAYQHPAQAPQNVQPAASVSQLTVLDKVNLSVQTGEICGIVGESGSGKSTLALTLMGMVGEALQQGSIKFKGQELLENSPRSWEKLRGSAISMVMQQSGEMLTPTLPLIDQIMEPYLKLYPRQKETAQRLGSQLLRRVGLDESYFYRYPHTLSGGEVQRALIAMALITDPELLILDEPVSSLDVRTKSDILNLLTEITAGRTVLVISHDLHTVKRLAHRTAVLYCGAILETGPAADCLQEPAHPYTRALVRAYPTLEGARELQGIRGEFPPLNQRPEGCPFHTRCTQSLDICSWQRPEPVEVGRTSLEHTSPIGNGRRQIACHRAGVLELLRCENVVQRYKLDKKQANGEPGNNYLEAVSGVSLTLREGEVYALVGESGSGKSTLGRILAGVDRPYRGEVFFQQQPLHKMFGAAKKEQSRNLQMLFQNSGEALSHRLNVHELVSEPLQIQKIGDPKSRQKAVRKALEWVNLPVTEHFLHEYPHHLSGGELQRVALARALVLEPKVLIADEPSASLDASVQAKIIKLLLHLQNERGFALILITHELALAAKAGDKVGVMYQGKIVEEGPPAKVLRYPQHWYTKTLTDTDTDRDLLIGDKTIPHPKSAG